MEDNTKKTDGYTPTEAEKRIIELSINPESFNMNIKDRCKAANVAKDTWYKAMAKPAFVAILNKATMDMLKSEVSDIVRATIKFAKTDSRCGSDRKVLLTMASLYTDKQEVKAEVDADIKVTMSPEVESWSK